MNVFVLRVEVEEKEEGSPYPNENILFFQFLFPPSSFSPSLSLSSLFFSALVL